MQLGTEFVTCYGATWNLVSSPGLEVVGTVRDKDTGKPLAGAVIRSYGAWGRSSLTPFRFKPGVTETLTYLSAVTDKEGRYRLDGIPKGEGNEIRAEGPHRILEHQRVRTARRTSSCNLCSSASPEGPTPG